MNQEQDNSNGLQATDKLETKQTHRSQFILLVKIAIISGLFGALGVAYSFTTPNTYTSRALLLPSSQLSGSDISSKLGGLSSLASLGGINLGGNADSKTNVALALLRSNSFLYEFLLEQEFLPLFFAAEKWDRGQNKIAIDATKYSIEKKEWFKFWDGLGEKLPVEYVGREFKRHSLSVYYDPLEKNLTLRITSLSPDFSKHVLTTLIEHINLRIRSLDLERLKAEIQDLEKSFQNESISSIKEATAEVLEFKKREYALSLSKSSNYVFTVLEAATLPYKKSGPKRLVYLVAGGALGFIISCLIFMRSFRLRDVFKFDK